MYSLCIETHSINAEVFNYIVSRLKKSLFAIVLHMKL